MAFTASQLAALESAAVSGTLRVRLGDQEKTYQNLADLMKVVAQARRDVSSSSVTAAETRRYYEHGRGY